MNKEGPHTKKIEQVVKQEEFPIIDYQKPYRFPDMPALQEGKIIHFVRLSGSPPQKSQDFFKLLETIEGLHYVFSLNETHNSTSYYLDFKTEEYEYATTNLGKEARNRLFITISKFLDSISKKYPNKIDEIWVTPAEASYSVEEIEKCVDEIFASPNNTLTREQITSTHKGFQVFDLYEEITGKDFLPIHYNEKSRAKGRSRLFKIMIRKHFPNWEIADEEPFSFSPEGDFFLKPKH